MNILILSWRGPKHPNAGGAEISTYEHAKTWAKAGHKVIWFSSFFQGAEKEEVVSGIKVIRKSRQILGVQIAAFYWYVFKIHPKFDLVVDQFHGIPFFTPLFVKTNKLAFIHEVAKEVWWLNPLPKPFNLMVAILGRIFEPWVFRLLYKKVPFMAVSESTKKDLIDWGVPSKNITVIHNGVTLHLPRPLLEKEKKKTAIFLGVLTKDKGIEDAIETFGLINQADPSWQFWVVGRGNEKFIKKLQDTCKELGVSRKFKFFDYVSDKKKFELLARAHVLINPSIREGWGLVNIEANAVSTPVVAYDVAGNRDSIKNGKTGILCREKSPECLAKEAINLLKDGVQYKKFCQQGKTWSKKFDWKTSTAESLKLVKGLI